MNGLTKVFIMGIGQTTTLTVKENTDGQTAEFTLENGKIISCMEEGCILGLTAENTKVSILMIKRMDKDAIPGQMASAIMEGGKMENNTEKQSLQIVKVKLK